MSFNTAVADVAARINEIQSQFVAPAAMAPKPAVAFSQVLAAAMLENPEAAQASAATAGRLDGGGDGATGEGVVSAARQLNSIFGALGTLGAAGKPTAAASTKGVVGIVNPSLGTTAYDELFAAAGAKYNVDPKLLSAVAKAESGYNPNAVSGAGARGLMQIMPATARGLGVDPLDPAQAVDGAARLLAGHISKFGSIGLAVAAYNAGGGAVSKYGGIPPYPETQNYVRKVLSYAGVTS